MNSFVETISPAARELFEARIAYYNDIALAVVQSTRELADVNLQFSRDWLRESTDAWQAALLTPPSERSTPAALSPETIARTIQAYQQQVAQVATNFQSAITEVAKQHVPQTARTATALAEVVARKATEQTDQQLRAGKAASKELMEQTTRFTQMATQNHAMQEPASMQSADGRGNKN